MKAAVERAWRAITGKRPTPYEFVVMPNHVHGIIWLGGPGHPKAQHGSNTDNTVSRRLGSRDGLPVKAGAAQLRRTVMPDSLGAKVRAFKAAVTRRINARRRTPGRPVWQEDYYEHVVRNEADLYRIRQYILDNPAKWADDPENPANARS
jgi:REP element-mobilizing transposase RayT